MQLGNKGNMNKQCLLSYSNIYLAHLRKLAFELCWLTNNHLVNEENETEIVQIIILKLYLEKNRLENMVKLQ